MAAKKDAEFWKNLLQIIKAIPGVDGFIEQGYKKIIDWGKNGLPFRKSVAKKLAEHDMEIQALKSTVAELIKDKIEGDGNG